MTIVTDKGIYPERLDWSFDNRDPGETWLQLEGTGDFISVSPVEVMGNMIENCYNEDVCFLFDQFTAYLNYINKDGEDTLNAPNEDHIKGFHAWLSNMIAQSGADKMVEEEQGR